MINKSYYFQNSKKNKQPVKKNLINIAFKQTSFLPYSVQIKNNSYTNIIINNEINLKESLNYMFKRANKIYDDYYYCNPTDINLDNEQLTNRTKIINLIKDFIDENLNYKKCNKDVILCEIIYIFDLLIINNKKCKNKTSFEKLGLGALILILKFNKLQENALIKKYKSIFTERYMTLDEINKIEVLALKMINYDIWQPNHIYYIELLYKNIFSLTNGQEQKNENIYKQILSIIKYIMIFSNNYIKYHPFYFSTFIIKFCFEKNKIEEFQRKFLKFFEINMREYRALYENFIKYFQSQINIANSLSKTKYEIKPEKHLNKSLVYYRASNAIKNNDNNKKNFTSMTAYNGFGLRKKKEINENNNEDKIKLGPSKLLMNYNGNIYYKKFMQNYIADNLSNSININTRNNLKKKNLNKSCKNIGIAEINKKNNNISLDSPKNCGISINYRLHKNLRNNINDNINIKNIASLNYHNKKEQEENYNYKFDKVNATIETSSINKKIMEKENNNIIQKEEIKNLNSELAQPKIIYKTRGDSIRKIYKRKNKEKNIDENIKNIKNENNVNLNDNYGKKEIRTIIKEDTLNKKKNYCCKLNINQTIDNNEIKKKSFCDENIRKNNNDDSIYKCGRNTINHIESYLKNNKEFDVKKNNELRRVRRLNIRNFYKNKNAII